MPRLRLVLIVVAFLALFSGRATTVGFTSPDNVTLAEVLQCVDKPSVPLDESTHLGGREAAPHSWPWLVSIRLHGRHNCSGVIYSPSHVITAARCVYDDEPASAYVVVAGRHCLDCEEEGSTEQRRKVVSLLAHPDYNWNNSDSDVALLTLDKPFVFDSRVSPACVASVPAADNATCLAAGWGSTHIFIERVFQTTLPIVPNSKCSDAEHYGAENITDNMICAGFDQGGVNSCQDDFGSPLMCKSPDDGGWHLQGVSSWGDGCDKVHRPVVFTRVERFNSWLLFADIQA